MLTGICNAQRPPATPGPREMLQDCHARIRHFSQLSRTLAEAGSASPTQVAEAAESVFRYFKYALPLHEADENETLYPRLRDLAPLGTPLSDAARAMVEQHHAIDELVGELLSLCDSLRQQPQRLPTLARSLQQVSVALERVFAAHLHMEETVIFPAITELPAAEREAMAREMQQRRRPQDIHIIR
jgi:iron-sulfur cluster repair protein YtfE (RIC family)